MARRAYISLFFCLMMACSKAPYQLANEHRYLPNWFAGFSERVFQYTQLSSDGDRVFFGSTRGRFYAANGQSGKRLWKTHLEGSIDTKPLVVSGVVYVGTSKGHFYALDIKTGNTKWSFDIPGEVLGEAVFANGKVFVGSHLEQLYALDAESGKLVWKYKRNASDKMKMHTFVKPLVSESRLVVGFFDGTLVCLDIHTGNNLWEQPWEDGEKFSDVAWLILLSNEILLAGKFNGNMATFRWDSGTLVTSLPKYASSVAPVLRQDGIISAANDGNVYSLDPLTGVLQWTFQSDASVRWSGMVEDNQRVLVTSYDGLIHVLSISEGRLEWTYHTHTSILGSPTKLGSKVWMLTQKGRLFSLKP